MLHIVGTICFGLTWGWLAGLAFGRSIRPWRDALSLLLATIALGGTVYLFTDWEFVLYFAGAALITCLIHVAWLTDLRRRYG